MTEIKIPFTKNKITDIPTSELSPGSRGVQVEITTNFLVYDLAGSFEKAIPPADSKVPFEKIAFIFKDNNTETAFYQALRDSNKTNFELSFDKEQVYLKVAGFASFIDLTKPQVHVNFKDLVVFFDSKSAGVIKLTESGQTPTGPTPQTPEIPGPETPPPSDTTEIQLTKKSAKRADGLAEPNSKGVEMEVEPFTLNTQRHGTKTFDKIVVIDNKNQNSDKLSFLLDSANQNIQINFLNNAKIDKWEGHEGGLISEQPNVT